VINIGTHTNLYFHARKPPALAVIIPRKILKGTRWHDASEAIKKGLKLKIVHLDKEYTAELWRPRWPYWRWRIPKDIVSHEALLTAMTLPLAPITPEAECFYNPDRDLVELDFIVPEGKTISKKIGYAFRNMKLANYSLSDPEGVDYPLLFEIRATWHSACPRVWRQDEEHRTTLIDALGTTVHNIQMHFTQSLQGAIKKEELKRGGTIDVTEGDEVNKKVSYGETEPFKYDHAEKYVRVKAKSGTWEYHTERIEGDLRANPFCIVDDKGFIWHVKKL